MREVSKTRHKISSTLLFLPVAVACMVATVFLLQETRAKQAQQVASGSTGGSQYLFRGDFDSSESWTVGIKPVLGGGSFVISKGYVGDGLQVQYKKDSQPTPKAALAMADPDAKIPFGGRGINIGNQDELYFRYRVQFMPDFAFAKSGLLPGLSGGDAYSGGWRAGTMWRDGAPASYIVIPGDAQQSMELPWKYRNGQRAAFRPGAWHCVETRMVLNDPGQKDGILQGWLDGQQAVNRDDVQYRQTKGMRIDAIIFSTFFGSADPSIASPEDQYVVFDDLILSEKKIGCQE